jgi:hypothetical protein
MKKIFIILFACTIGNIQSQTSPTAPLGKTTFGLRAGISFQNFNGKDMAGDMLENSLVTRFSAGANVEIPVAVDFYFQPGLLFATKGSLKNQVIADKEYKANVNLSYLELPLNLVYKPLLGTGHLVLGFGPYLGYGIGGRARYTLGDDSYSEKVKFKNEVNLGDASDVTYFRAFDAGANLLAGYEFTNRLSFQLNVQLGLSKVNPNYTAVQGDKSSAKNTGFGLSVGYRL